MTLRFAGYVAAALSLLPAVASAQDAETQETAAQTEVAEAPSVEEMLERVTASAGQLQGRIDTLEADIQKSANSEEIGVELLDSMLTAAQTVRDEVGIDSPLWQGLGALMDNWAMKRDAAYEKAATRPAFAEIAESWVAKINETQLLRDGIVEQSAEADALIAQIKKRRDLVISYYELDQADKVLETMRGISTEMEAMNSGMRGIVEQTEVVAGEGIDQQ